MRLRKQGWPSLHSLLLMCAVVSLFSQGGGSLQFFSHSISGDQPLSRRGLSAQEMPRDVIAARGQSFSLELFKNQRPQLDQAIAGNAPKVVLPGDRIARVSTSPDRHSSTPPLLPTGRAPPLFA